jgi:hypothetical protein
MSLHHRSAVDMFTVRLNREATSEASARRIKQEAIFSKEDTT